MKLRVRGNTLRLRLTQPEVARLAEVGRVEEVVVFGGGDEGRLTYAIGCEAEAKTLAARLGDRRIDVIVPTEIARAWASSDEVGLEAAQPVDAAGAALCILVEKDFACLKPRADEDDRDAFPNPDAPRR